MSAEELDRELLDGLAPDDAPSDEDIENYLRAAEIDVAHEQAAKPPFRVDTYGKANWAGRKIAEAQQRIDEARQWRDEVIAKAEAAFARERARHEPKIEFFEAHLTDWLRREIEADTSKEPRKSRDLDGGITVKRTPPGKSLVVDDEDALVDWLKDHRPDLVESKMVWEWSKADVKKLAADDGRLVAALVDDETGEKVEIEAKGARVEQGEPGWKVDR